MQITYHKQVSKSSDVENTIPHNLLCTEVKEFLNEYAVVQKRYYFYDNGFYWFLYLDNGDRVDVNLRSL